jgi:hypothetical protein
VPRVNRSTPSNVFALLAAALGVVGIITRPFLFVPVGLVCLLLAAKLSADRRFTGLAAAFLALCAVAGAAIAAGFTKPLY